jgi:hypothetical protein
MQRPRHGLGEPLRASRPQCADQGAQRGPRACSTDGQDGNGELAVIARRDSTAIARRDSADDAPNEPATKKAQSGVREARTAVTTGDSKDSHMVAARTVAMPAEHDGVRCHRVDPTLASHTDEWRLEPHDPNLHAFARSGRWCVLRRCAARGRNGEEEQRDEREPTRAWHRVPPNEDRALSRLSVNARERDEPDHDDRCADCDAPRPFVVVLPA